MTDQSAIDIAAQVAGILQQANEARAVLVFASGRQATIARLSIELIVAKAEQILKHLKQQEANR